MLSTIRSFFYKFKRYQAPLEKYVFPVALLLYPLIGVNLGIDIADTTYSLTNFEYMSSIDPMWILSTFISNLVGKLFMQLPFGNTMLGIGIYCSFLISFVALVSYYMLQDYMPGWMIFIGLFIAESLCWCPKAILYNNLSYVFLSLGVLMLLKGMFVWKRQELYLFLAGVFLGINVMVRFPNIVEASLILILWFYLFITKEELPAAAKKTGICIGGYVTGFGIFYLITCIMYGPLAYFNMIGSLFSMTSGASDYSSGGMISMIIEGYTSVLIKMAIIVPCMLAGIVMFMLKTDKYIWIKKGLYVAGLLILVRYFFAVGTFTRNYTYYDSIFSAAMMFVIIAVIIGILGSTGFLNGNKQEQALSFAVVMLILVLPVGSNNYTYPILNCLFIIAPITLWLIRRLMQRLGDKDINFPWQAMITMVIIVLLIQGTIFHFRFAFGDGMDGTDRDSYVSGIEKISGMKTTKANADSLKELNDFLSEKSLMDEKTIFFGGVPGLSYIYDLEPAINTTWPDLDSYSVDKFETALSELSVSEEPEPMIIVGKDMAEYANINSKYDILLDYMAEHDYNKVFENERLTVFVTGFESED